MKQSGASAPPSHVPKPSPSTNSWTKPEPTDVIRYVYLWQAERERGLEDGKKPRPCLVLSTHEIAGRLRDNTAPTIMRDYSPDFSVPLPNRVTGHLGLDERSRIVWNDLNEFTWIGPDVRLGPDGTSLIGIMPSTLWKQAIDKIVSQKILPTHRSE